MTRSGAILTAPAAEPTSFWAWPQISNRGFLSRERIPLELLGFASFNPAPSVLSALPGADKVLKSPVIAKTLQTAYHGLNTKARKYEPLSPQERLKWEAYYAADQKDLSDLLRGLWVVE